MAPVLPTSTISNVSFTPETSIIARKNNFLTRSSGLRKSSKQIVPLQKYFLPLSTSVRLFPQLRGGYFKHPKSRTHVVSATDTNVAVEEADSSVGDANPVVLETPLEVAENSEDSSAKPDASSTPARSIRPRSIRKSEMAPVNNEELIPGATFTGKVRSIQPFGAFVDFGAFTDGLVHVSQLSDSFVKDVNSVVSIGQEVTVRLVEANTETGRISLTMRLSSDSSRLQQQKDDGSSGDKSRSPRRSTQKPNQRRDDGKKSSKFVKGQDLEGTVKSLNRAGAFISLPEGEEGFLPVSEEADEGFGNMMGGGSSLQAGQEVSVRVLRITRGQVTLTMKKDEVSGALDSKLIQGVVHSATNPFVLAFRNNEEISSFLDEREKEEEPSEIPKEDVRSVDEVNTADDALTGTTDKNEEIEDVLSDSLQIPDADKQGIEEVEEVSETLAPESSASSADQVTDAPSALAATENIEESQTAKEILAEENVVITDVAEQVDDVTLKNDVEAPSEESKVIASPQDEVAAASPASEENGILANSNGQIDVPSEPESSSEDSQVTEEVQNQIENAAVMDEGQAEAPVPVFENTSTGGNQDEGIPTTQENGNTAADSSPPSQQEATPKAAISPALVKQLREETGAGMMDCKKALSETGGDLAKAQEYLRKKGLASADKKASRVTAEGRIGSYIHDSRIGVLIEVNCETDFVSRGNIFKELVDDLAMQVAACPQVQYVVADDVPQEIVDKEREIEMQKEDLLSKPEQIRSKIVDGRIRKRLEELALLEQPYIKNDKAVVKDWVKQTIATIGENIKVKRFVRYNLGEGLEKKSQDFAAEVAAQTTAKSVSTPAKAEPAAVEAKDAIEAPKPTVSAALVKQLREETGAGMMDCKKALSENGGDLEKAQEYLRKKGLSSADKKSSRLAAEGRIGAYIHDSRIGVLIEVNCETDFVGRSEKFKELVDDLAMQVVACPQVQYVSIEDIPESIVSKEKELEMQREDLQSKPENIREKIVEGRISKRLGELALLEQSFIKDDSVLVKDLVKQTVAALGENIKARRFIRFTLGEEVDVS